jgi:protein-tyrosine phosphatase
MTQYSMSHSIPQPILQGASNFRDIGGLTADQGSRVRNGRVFRSDHLAALTPSDVAKLQALPLTHSIDFRGVSERAALPYEITGSSVVALPIEPTVVRKLMSLMEKGQVPTTDETVELMCDTYRGFVHEQGPTFGRFLRHLIAHPTPVVFHCTAGKDRTGFAAALLLSALGVDRDTIMEDYLLTNRLYRRDPAVEGHGPAHVMAVLWQVQPRFLQAAFDTMDREYGGLSRYLSGPVGINAPDLEQLRRTLLVH